MTYKDYHKILEDEEKRKEIERLDITYSSTKILSIFDDGINIDFLKSTNIHGVVKWILRFTHPVTKVFTLSDIDVMIILNTTFSELRKNVRNYNGDIINITFSHNGILIGQIAFNVKENADIFLTNYIEPLLIMKKISER